MKIDPYENYVTTTVAASRGELRRNAVHKRALLRTVFQRYIPVERDTPILDIGCGYGAYVEALGELRYSDVTGIDLSHEQIEVARQELGLSNVHVADAFAHLKDAPGRYGAVLLFDVIEHLPTEESIELLRNVRSALRPGGRLLVMAPNAISPFNPYRYADVTHHRAYTVHSLGQSFAMSQLRAVHIGEPICGPITVRDAFRWLHWYCVARPICRAACLTVHGTEFGSVFSRNIFGVAERAE